MLAVRLLGLVCNSKCCFFSCQVRGERARAGVDVGAVPPLSEALARLDSVSASIGLALADEEDDEECEEERIWTVASFTISITSTRRGKNALKARLPPTSIRNTFSSQADVIPSLCTVCPRTKRLIPKTVSTGSTILAHFSASFSCNSPRSRSFNTSSTRDLDSLIRG